MEVAGMASPSILKTCIPPPPTRSRPATCSATSSRPLSFAGGSLACQFPGLKLWQKSPFSYGNPRSRRGLVTMVIPFENGAAWEQPPPDLASYLFKERIVYLGMPFVPAVTELICAELLYLQHEDYTKTIYMYINSTGTSKGETKFGFETEALAIYDIMMFVRPPIYTLCVGYAFGEAALVLAAGVKGHRAALPSSSIMIRQPMAWFRGQATDIDIARKEVKNIKSELVKLYALHMGQTPEQIEADIERPKYFSPPEAVEYGIIDRIIYTDKNPPNDVLVSKLKGSQLI